MPYTYQWNGNPANNNDTLLRVPVGIYIINVTDSNGCSQADTFQVLEAPSTSLIRLGPNPTSGVLTVFDLEAFGLDLPIHFELWDMNGKLRMEFEIQGLDIYSFNLDDSLYNNEYNLRIYNDRYEETRKIQLLK